MRNIGVRGCAVLAFVCFADASLAETAKSIPLDRQLDLNLPQKSDPLVKKKIPAKPKKIKKKISYDGVWQVLRGKDSCTSRIGDFKVRIEGQDITTVVGMNIEGTMRKNGAFEMKAKSRYWQIKFKGFLKEKSGNGEWTKIGIDKSKCSGSIRLKRAE